MSMLFNHGHINAQSYWGKHFYSNADFRNHKFDSTANFEYTHFHSTADFGSAEFDSTADFVCTQVDSTADFDHALFYSTANFGSAEFYSYANIRNAEFHSTADFVRALFYSTANFLGTKFHSTADFSIVEFDSTCIFFIAQFDSTADFRLSQFLSTADFKHAKFRSFVNFSSSIFYSKTYFDRTILPDSIDFRNVKDIANEIDFTVSVLDSAKKVNGKKCRIALYGSDIKKIKINYELFELYFPAPDTSFEKKISVYEKLLQKFKDDGFIESYKSLDIEYREFKYLKNKDYFLNWFQKYWWNYGYNKEKVVYWSLRLFCLFSFFNLFLFPKLQSSVYAINFDFFTKADFNEVKKGLTQYSSAGSKKFIQIRYYWLILIYMFSVIKRFLLNPLIYTAILFFGIKVTFENFKKLNIWTLWVLLIFTSGLFCLAYIANIIIVK